MRRHGLWGFFYYLCYWLQLAALGLVVGVGATPKIDPQSWPSHWQGAIRTVQGAVGWLIPTLAIVAGTLKLTADQIGPPSVWKSVQRLLNSFRNEVFVTDSDQNLDKHRITIFKRVKFCCKRRPGRRWCWPWGAGWHPFSGWLVPVARSGHTKQRTKTIFLAPDDTEHTEGVVGRVWAGQRTIMASNLPDLKACPSDENLREYANRTMVTEEWVRWRIAKGKSCSRSICCIYLEVKGDPWGVIVLDSTEPEAINSHKHGWAMFEKMAPVVFSELLKRT